MLVWLIEHLAREWPDALGDGWLSGATKITFRATLAALAGFVVAVAWGPRVIRWLRVRFREPLSDRSLELRKLHQHKAATPTMGGLFLVAGIAAAVLLLGDWQNAYLPVALFNLLALAGLGMVDDLSKLSGHCGLRPRAKLAGQAVIASIAAVWLYQIQRQIPGGLELQLPISGHTLALGGLFIPLAVAVIVGSSNAVNLTDGLDGLAGGCLIIAGGAIGGMAYAAGHRELAAYLGIAHMPQAGEMTVIAAALAGGTLGFLWFNCQPAQVFMGDTGSLSLGGTLGLVAVVARQELLLLVVGGVFVAEAVSVLLQIYVHRWTGRRVFRCAPLHHHFQFLGWSESKIVARFWIVAVLCALVGLGGLKLNGQAERGDLRRFGDGSKPASVPMQTANRHADQRVW